MIDDVEAATNGIPIDAFDVIEIDIIYGPALFKAVDEVDDCTTDGANGRQAKFTETGRDIDGLCTVFNCQIKGFGRIPNPKAHCARRRAVFAGVVPGGGRRLVVGQHVDSTLTPDIHIF